MGDLRVPSFVFSLEPRAAVEWFRAKGHRLSWNWQETWQEAHARAFTVAKVTRMDVLNDIRGAVSTALSEGKTERWFQQQLQPVLEEKGWWGKALDINPDDFDTRVVQLGSHRRLQTIFRTNLQTSYMAGRWTDMVRNARDRPYWMYVAVMDSKTRPSHAAMHGKVYRWDDPIWQTHFPPCGFNCRCRVRALSERQVQRMGLGADSSAGKIERKKVQAGFDPRTGEIYESEVSGIKLIGRDGRPITYWTDPGWNYNPGQAAYMPDLDRYPTDTARQFVEGVVTGPEFERWFSLWRGAVSDATAGVTQDAQRRSIVSALARGRGSARAAYDLAGLTGTRLPSGMEYPVGVLRQRERDALRTPSQTVHLSSGTLIEHLGAHPDIGLADYQKLQRMIDIGEVYMGGDDTRVILLAEDGRLYKSVLKIDQPRSKIYLTTLFRLSEADANRQVRNRFTKIR